MICLTYKARQSLHQLKELIYLLLFLIVLIVALVSMLAIILLLLLGIHDEVTTNLIVQSIGVISWATLIAYVTTYTVRWFATAFTTDCD